MARPLLLLLFLLLLPAAFTSSSACDNFVRALGRRYRRIVRCSHGNLTRVPQLERRSLRVSELLLDDNRIARLNDRSFHSWVDIERLSLRNNRLTRISIRAFRPLRRLKRLNLSGNLLHLPQGLSPPALAFVPEIVELHLSFNPLRTIPPFHFQVLSQLQLLHLRDVARPSLQLAPGAFGGLRSLHTLDLTSNFLETLPESVLGGLANSRRLRSILLGGANRWRCDCRLRWLKKRHLRPPRRSDEAEALVAAIRPRCESPVALHGRDLLTTAELREDDFQCEPELKMPRMTQVTAAAGNNVSLSCQVEADPLKGFEWLKDRHRLRSSRSRPFFKTLTSRGQQIEARLLLLHVRPRDSGRWSCVAWNARGRVRAEIDLVVVQPCDSRAVRVLGFTVMLAWGLLILCVAGIGLCWLQARRRRRNKRLARLAQYALVKEQRPKSNVYLEEKL